MSSEKSFSEPMTYEAEAVIISLIRAMENLPDTGYNYEDADMFKTYFAEHPNEKIMWANKRDAFKAQIKLRIKEIENENKSIL